MSTLTLENLAGRKPQRLSWVALGIGLILVFVGVIVFWTGVTGPHATAAWSALLTNYMTFTQFGMAGLVFAAIANMTKSAWMRPLKRIAESFTVFLPLSFVLLLALWAGRYQLWTWMQNPAAVMRSTATADYTFKLWWLNEPFFWIRQFVILAVFNVLAWAYRRASLRPDELFLAGRRDAELNEAIERSQRRQIRLAPLIAVLYALLWTLHSWDMLMSLDWRAADTMLGGWEFTSGMLVAWALVNLYATWYRKHAYLDDVIGPQQYHDLGKLMFAFGIFWTYLMWSQFLPIWYGNLPDETPYVWLRVYHQPWRSLSLALPFMVWLIPFWVLMPVKAKRSPWVSGAMALLILAGLWLERFVLVAPNLSPNEIPLGWVGLWMTLGLLSAFWLMTTRFLERHPVLPLTDPYFKYEL